MGRQPYILSIDQGTTSSRAILFDDLGNAAFTAQEEFEQIFPESGWVEHNPEAIWRSTLNVCRKAVAHCPQLGGEIVGIGITNQRETTVVWDRATGDAIYNAIVWQDRRTAEKCVELKAAGHEAAVTEKTGLLLDPYFSGTKVAWILDHVEGARERAERGELAFGTIDSFLIWKLTQGRVHATDATNASRTLLYNIRVGEWDDSLLELLRVPSAVLPEVKDCAADYGACDPRLLGRDYPICGVVGDQQAAAFGQACYQPGMIKSTYGTGCFVLMNTGAELVRSKNRMLGTVAYQLNGEVNYALEGSIFVAGAAVQWLRDGIGLIENAEQTQALAQQSTDHGVYMVPAFTGLGAPYWDPDVRGAVFGLSRGTGKADLVRATLDSVVYQTHDLLQAMAEDGCGATQVRVDGGMVRNDWLVQRMADLLGIEVVRPQQVETTALGAAYMAGLQAGLYDSLDELAKKWQKDMSCTPLLEAEARQPMLDGWARAVRQARTT